MPVTYGRNCGDSSPSAALTQSLESKYRARMAGYGSPEYALRWKRWVTVLGPRIFVHQALERRTSGNDFTGWPSPNTPSGGPNSKSTPTHQGGMDLEGAATLTGWPSPQARDSFPAHSDEYVAEKKAQGHGMANLNDVVGWASPSSRDWKDTPGMSTTGTNPDGSERTRLDQLPRQAHLAGWRSPQSEDGERGQNSQTEHLETQARKAGWPTPNAMEGGQTSRGGERKDEKLMGGLVSGLTPSGTPAATAKSGGLVLNPRFSLWLMGYPDAWHSCAVRAIASARKSRRNLSKHSSKPNNET